MVPIHFAPGPHWDGIVMKKFMHFKQEELEMGMTSVMFITVMMALLLVLFVSLLRNKNLPKPVL